MLFGFMELAPSHRRLASAHGKSMELECDAHEKPTVHGHDIVVRKPVVDGRATV